MTGVISQIRCRVNGRDRVLDTDPRRRLTEVLRDDLGLTGTKVGCDAGDCGACTVLLDGRQVCACLLAAGQLAGRAITTVEGLGNPDRLDRLQRAFHRHGAVQCGICTPGMLMAASELLAADPTPDAEAVEIALSGVLCRCTGYGKIVEAVIAAGRDRDDADLGDDGGPVGARMQRVDGAVKLTGQAVYGADRVPEGCLGLRAVRSPHPHARFTLGDLGGFARGHPGLTVLTAADVRGVNCYGVYPLDKDQPVLADGYVRHRGEAVLALVGAPDLLASLDENDLPILYEPLASVVGIDGGMAADTHRLHDARPGNVLAQGRLMRGDAEAALARAHATAEGTFETSFVEHAYIEPEAGYAVRVGDRIEIFASTQSPYLDRDEVAHILGLSPEQVRIIPSACGGGFGGKLDLSVQPLIALAAWITGKPVRWVWTRPESMAVSTKRHPARIVARFGADSDGHLTAARFHGDFETGAYASWGPTVANRVPVHAAGPYRVEAVQASSRAIHTNGPIAGAFRGFGVPQAAIAHEALIDELAERLGLDPLEFRHLNALGKDALTPSGQRLEASVGLRACLDALRGDWHRLRAAARAFRDETGRRVRGAGIACGWYGIGNTSLANPSTMRLALGRDGAFTLYSGAVDIGQGSDTILVQICAEALGVPAAAIALSGPDTDRTEDAGKTSASRQTFVSGRAVQEAALALRAQILRLANVSPSARIVPGPGVLHLHDDAGTHDLVLATFAGDASGAILSAEGRFDPPTTPLDADGQGVPYATYSFAAQVALVEVDLDLGQTRIIEIAAAADVGRAINPTQVEGQIHGGIAQGLGMALMEEYVPGRSENLHDYLIPTIGDMPKMTVHIVEDPEPLGPYGAKGIGEPALIPTAPAILNAIKDATGVRPTFVPVTPARLLAALAERGARVMP